MPAQADPKNSTANRSEITRIAIARELHKASQPLTALQGILEMTLSDPMTPPKSRETIEMALAEACRAVQSFEQMRQLVSSAKTSKMHHPSGAVLNV